MPKIYSKGIKVKDGNGVWHDLPTVVSEESMRAAEDARASSAAAEQSAAAAEAAAEYASQWPAYEAMEAAQEAAASADQAASSAADAVRALAVVEGQFPEGIATAVTEWLEDNVDPVGSAVTVDSSLLIEGSAADAFETGENIRYNTHKVFSYEHDGSDTTVKGVTWSWNNGVLTFNGTSSGDSYRYYYDNTASLPVGMEAGGTYKIRYRTTDKRVLIQINVYSGGSTTGTGTTYYFREDGIFRVPSDATGMKISARINGSGYSVDGFVKQFDVLCEDGSEKEETEFKSESHGVREIRPIWHQGLLPSYTYPPYAPAASDANYGKYVSCEPIPIPPEGIYLYCDELLPLVVHYYKHESTGRIVAASNYPYCYQGQTGYAEITASNVRYCPYQEGVYVCVGCKSGSSFTVSDANEKIHLFCGKIAESGGRLPNLSCCSVAGKYASGVLANQKLYFYPYYGQKTPEAGNSSKINTTDYRAHYYVSVLRLRDIERIVVAPPYSATARIYRVDDDDKEITVYDEIFSPVSGDPAMTGDFADVFGKSVLDFRSYGIKGYVLIGITMEPVESKEVNASNQKYLKSTPKSNGMLAKYDDVLSHVFVEWKPGVSVTFERGIPATAKSNIQTVLESVFAPNLTASPSEGGYGNYSFNQEGAISPFEAKGEVHGWWYNGGNRDNVPHMHVTPKSFITASKNHHSRVYIPKANGTDMSRYENLYGSVCSTTASLVCGRPEGIETIMVASRLIPDLECRDLTTIDDVRPGDLIAAVGNIDPEAGGSFGHIQYVVETVNINGETFCANVFEGAMPWTSFKTTVNLESLDGYVVNETDVARADATLFEYFTSRYFDNKGKVVLARLPARAYKSIRTAYGPYDTQDYAVTEIMCDRGTDAVYCIGEYMTLFVTDGTTEIELYKDGTSIGTVDLTEYPVETYDDGKVYNVTGMIESAGYYEIYAGDPLAKKESFFVPTNKYLTATRDDAGENAKIHIFFDPNEEDDEVVSIDVWYSADGTGYPLPFFTFDAETEDENHHATFDAPRTITTYENQERVGNRVEVLRKTPYGTYSCIYWISGAYTPRQRAGHPFAE